MLQRLFLFTTLTLVVQCIKILTVVGQDVHYSNMYENMFRINPSSITQTDELLLHLNYRNQWPGSNDFVTYDGAFFVNADNLKSTIGTAFSQDNQASGVFTRTEISLFYGYDTKISRFFDISAGIKISYNLLNSDFSGLVLEDGSIPPNDENTQFFDFAVGIELISYENSRFGVAASHISNPEINSVSRLTQKYSITYMGNYRLNSRFTQNNLTVEPVFQFSYQSPFTELFYGGRTNYNFLTGGIFLRQNLKFQFDAMIILLGTYFSNISFYYTYDINLSAADSRFTKLAAHEVTFLYKIEYNIKSRKKGAIKCP